MRRGRSFEGRATRETWPRRCSGHLWLQSERSKGPTDATRVRCLTQWDWIARARCQLPDLLTARPASPNWISP